MGDSNTHGTLPMAALGERRRLGRRARWPGVAAEALGPGWHVIEEGLPGRTTVHPDPVEGAHLEGLAALPALLASHAPIDVLALMLGTNDLKPRFAAGPLDIALAAERLLVAARRSEAGPGGAAPRLLLVAPPPVLEAGCLAELFAGGAAKSRRLASLYAEAAARQGAAFLDAGAVIGPDPLDGVHFGAEAHAALGRAIAARVLALAD